MTEKNYYEKRLEKFEAKKRAQLGDEGFLRKYTVRIPRVIKLNQILMPLNIVLASIVSGLWIFSYFYFDRKPLDLAFGITWGCIALFWCSNTYIFFAHRIKILKQRTAEWKNELENSNSFAANN